ncbi:NUDIX hydrolase [Photobacterium damselae]|uniref:NUDIX hydrolase n=1 Tax=Photobacterium damselae TaxID=38293 RepID=UPI001EFEB008|nr:NUDIX domain-containing protein [Photobacterium damselae]MCG9780665.1 NUDIX domain-containing protein [Photobacterium damselae]
MRDTFLLDASVFVLLKDPNGKILLIQRSGTGWKDGYYSLPAGRLEKGETLISAAVRELKEEVDIDCVEGDLNLSHVLHARNENEIEWLGFFYTLTKWSGEPKICEPDKHNSLKWTDEFELDSNVIEYVKQAIENIRSSVSYSNFGW